MRGRWHGGAVADEVRALASTRRCPPHQSPPATASLIGEATGHSAFPKASPSQGEVARRSRDGEVVANLMQPPQSASLTAPPGRGAFPRKKVTSIWISKAPSIDSNCSTATSYKFGTPVSGGAYQDARKVSLVWNARPKHWDLPEFRCSMHPIVTKHPFSFPYLFRQDGKDRGHRRRVRNDHNGTNPCKQGFLSSVLVSFQTASQTCGLGFIANLLQPQSAFS